MSEVATIENILPRTRLVSDGSLQTISPAFELLNQKYVLVYFGNELQENTKYSVDTDTNIITFYDPIPVSTTVTVLRAVPTDWLETIREKGALDLGRLNSLFVELVAKIQTIEEQVSRAPTMPVYEDIDGESYTEFFFKSLQDAMDVLDASKSNLNDLQTEGDRIIGDAEAEADRAETAANSAANSAQQALVAANHASSGNIGDIKYTVRKGTAPFGGVWCDGSTYTKTQYPDIWTLLTENKLEKVDIATYNSVLALNGSCGFIGVDTEYEMFRVPTLPNKYFTGAKENVPVVGNGKTLGLKNGNIEYGLNVGTNTGMLYANTGSINKQAMGSSWTIGTDASGLSLLGITTNPTKSGMIADTSSLLKYIEYKPYIILFTGQDITSDVSTEIQLNNPFSLLDYKWSEYELSNASWLLSNGQFNSGTTYTSVYQLLLEIKNGTETKAGVSVKLSTQTYTDYDFVINTTDTTFRLPVKVKLASGSGVAGNGKTLGFTDGINRYGMNGNTSYTNNDMFRTGSFDVPIGPISQTGSAVPNGNALGITIDPTKSGIETSSQGLKLYFYVGETIQDANVIAASSVLSRVAELSDSHISGLGMPSNKYINLTLGASGSTYTAPANGYFAVQKTSGVTAGYIQFINEANNMGIEYATTLQNYVAKIYIPVKKGDNVKVGYNLTGTTNSFRFIYAEGAE